MVRKPLDSRKDWREVTFVPVLPCFKPRGMVGEEVGVEAGVGAEAEDDAVGFKNESG